MGGDVTPSRLGPGGDGHRVAGEVGHLAHRVAGQAAVVADQHALLPEQPVAQGRLARVLTPLQHHLERLAQRPGVRAAAQGGAEFAPPPRTPAGKDSFAAALTALALRPDQPVLPIGRLLTLLSLL